MGVKFLSILFVSHHIKEDHPSKKFEAIGLNYEILFANENLTKINVYKVSYYFHLTCKTCLNIHFC